MALNLESLMKVGKEVLAGMVLDYKDKFETPLTNIKKELTYETNSRNLNLILLSVKK